MNNSDHTLRTLFWESTLRCNAGCEFCGSRCTSQSRDEADSETVIRTFERIAAAYPAGSIMVNVTGGEPLLRKDLFDVMEKIHQMGFPWGIVTNGSLITDDVISRMKETGMRTISISIDGLFEAHENIRKLPNSFPRIISAIRKLAEAAFLDEIQITTVVTKNNIRDLEEMFGFFSELPINSWRIAPVDPIGRCEDQRQLLLDAEDFRCLADFMDSHTFDERLILQTSCSHYFGNADTLYRNQAFHCDTGKNVASILADGSIYVCPNVPRINELIQGNIKTDDFVERWENGFRWFRNDDERKIGRCASCNEWEKCKGDSVHTWDFERHSPKFCWLDHAQVKQKDFAIPDRIADVVKQHTPTLSGYKISYGSSSLKKVFVLPDAAEKLYHEFRWGRTHPTNIFEQMSALVGFVEDNCAYVVDLIVMPLRNRSDNLAVFDDELHQYALSELDIFNRNLPLCDDVVSDQDGQVTLLGYIHSHPMNLRTTMSLPDIALHHTLRQRLSENALTSIVNPQTGDLCFYWDSVFSPVDVILFSDKNAIEKW